MSKKRDWWKSAFSRGIYPLDKIADSFEWKKRTQREVDFLSKALNLKHSQKLLDIACGTGRHAILFARKGYIITGVDVSKKYLNLAKKAAQKQGVPITLVRRDMRQLGFSGEFDAAVNLFTSFGYFDKKSDDLKVLKRIYQALRSKGRFVIDTINGPFLLKNFIKKNWNRMNDFLVLEKSEFMKRENRVRTKWTFIYDDREEHMESSIRIYSKASLTCLLEKAGFKILKYFGNLQGDHFTSEQSPRLVILAEKEVNSRGMKWI